MEDTPNVWQLLGKHVINLSYFSFFLPKFQSEISVVTDVKLSNSGPIFAANSGNHRGK